MILIPREFRLRLLYMQLSETDSAVGEARDAVRLSSFILLSALVVKLLCRRRHVPLSCGRMYSIHLAMLLQLVSADCHVRRNNPQLTIPRLWRGGHAYMSFSLNIAISRLTLQANSNVLTRSLIFSSELRTSHHPHRRKQWQRTSRFWTVRLQRRSQVVLSS